MIIGKKVSLGPIERVSIEWMRQQRNDPDLRKYFREWKDISSDQQERWYESRGNNSDPNHVYFEIRTVNSKKAWSDRSIQENELIGCCGLHYIDWRLRSAEFGVFLCQKVRGMGMGKEALELLFDYGFKEMNLHKIWAEVYNNNKAIDLYTDVLGMKVDGKIRHSQFTDGKYIDSTLLSILEDEWKCRLGDKHEAMDE